MRDYRNTSYCTDHSISKEKCKLEQIILKHKTTNHYMLISRKKSKYNESFLKVYNCKCGYCGVSIRVISKDLFQVDHFVCKSSRKSFRNKELNDISNLISCCHKCNNKKSGLVIPSEYEELLYPDGEYMGVIFERDKNYKIIISDRYFNDGYIKDFYSKIGFEDETRRLDYLIMEMEGFCKKYKDTYQISQLFEVITLLRIKRNIV